MPEDSRGVEPSPSYQLFMLVLCIFALGQLGVQAAFRLEPSTRAIIEYADLVVCIVFFVDCPGSWPRGSLAPAGPRRPTSLIAWRERSPHLRIALDARSTGPDMKEETRRDV